MRDGAGRAILTEETSELVAEYVVLFEELADNSMNCWITMKEREHPLDWVRVHGAGRTEELLLETVTICLRDFHASVDEYEVGAKKAREAVRP